jgi:hypothetical protein
MDTKVKKNTDVAGCAGTGHIAQFVGINTPTKIVEIPATGMPLEDFLKAAGQEYSANIRINSDTPEKGLKHIVMPNDIITSVEAVEGGK